MQEILGPSSCERLLPCTTPRPTMFLFSLLFLFFQFSYSVMLDSLLPLQRLQHARLPCPSPPTPGVCSSSCPLSQWCHPTISSPVDPLSSCLQSFPASGSFLMSQFFASGGQSIGASASVLPMNIQEIILRVDLGKSGGLLPSGQARATNSRTASIFNL